MHDFVFKQNPDKTYITNNEGALQKANQNAIVDSLLEILEKIYTKIITLHKIRPAKIDCNVPLLAQALSRYSRDIFGESRLKARTDYLKRIGRLTDEQYKQLTSFGDYGFKTDSIQPYIHRQVSNLLYWLSTLKPFSIEADDKSVKQLGIAFEFHNEFISYCLVLSMLKIFNLTLNIHKKPDALYDFLYDLHFRKLSRSSLEFFLDAYTESI
jgi:hypothetical protein